MERHTQLAQRKRRALNGAVVHVETKFALHLPVRIRARVEGAAELEPIASFIRGFPSEQILIDDPAAIARSGLRIEQRLVFEESALIEILSPKSVLRQQGQKKEARAGHSLCTMFHAAGRQS